MKRSHFWGLLLVLVLLAGCAASASQTATVNITPTPTIPTVPSRMVHFQTSDHIQLAGLLYGQGKTAVICSHQLDATKAIWDITGMPQRLAARGYLVLAYDFRGYGDSAGERDPTQNANDLRAAIAFAHQQGAAKVVLLGSSMGGTASLQVASSETLAAVITLSAPQAFGVEVTNADVQAISAPKLFVNSEGDGYASDTSYMYTIASEPKQLQLYPGAEHGVAMFEADYGASLIKLLLDFIARYAPVR
jgi:alpha/beta superfamily hydrolase